MGEGEEGREEVRGKEVKTTKWSQVFTYRRWSIFWKFTLLCQVVLHLYVTRLTYLQWGFSSSLGIFALPVVGDAGVCWGSDYVPLIRAFQVGITMLLVSWFYRVCLRAHGLLPGRYSYPDGSSWQQKADGSRVCVEWSHRYVNGQEWWFDPEDGRGVRFKSPGLPREAA